MYVSLANVDKGRYMERNNKHAVLHSAIEVKILTTRSGIKTIMFLFSVIHAGLFALNALACFFANLLLILQLSYT